MLTFVLFDLSLWNLVHKLLISPAEGYTVHQMLHDITFEMLRPCLIKSTAKGLTEDFAQED